MTNLNVAEVLMNMNSTSCECTFVSVDINEIKMFANNHRSSENRSKHLYLCDNSDLSTVTVMTLLYLSYSMLK